MQIGSLEALRRFHPGRCASGEASCRESPKPHAPPFHFHDLSPLARLAYDGNRSRRRNVVARCPGEPDIVDLEKRIDDFRVTFTNESTAHVEEGNPGRSKSQNKWHQVAPPRLRDFNSRQPVAKNIFRVSTFKPLKHTRAIPRIQQRCENLVPLGATKCPKNASVGHVSPLSAFSKKRKPITRKPCF